MYELVLGFGMGEGRGSFLTFEKLFLQLLECNELLQESKGALEEGKNYTYAIEAVGEVIDAGGPVVGAALRHDCLCVRAAALLKV
jgi:hypothetical protein